MNRIFIIAVILFATSTVSFAQTDSQNKTVEREVAAAENEILKALTNDDVKTFEQMLADDFFTATPDGKTANKKLIIAAFKPDAGLKLKSFTTKDAKILVLGNEGAAVTGIDVLKYVRDGEKVAGLFRFTRIYVKRQGRWQVLYQQLTDIREE